MHCRFVRFAGVEGGGGAVRVRGYGCSVVEFGVVRIWRHTVLNAAPNAKSRLFLGGWGSKVCAE